MATKNLILPYGELASARTTLRLVEYVLIPRRSMQGFLVEEGFTTLRLVDGLTSLRQVGFFLRY